MTKRELDLLQSACNLIYRLRELASEKFQVSYHGDDALSCRTINEIEQERAIVMEKLEAIKKDLLALWN